MPPLIFSLLTLTALSSLSTYTLNTPHSDVQRRKILTLWHSKPTLWDPITGPTPEDVTQRGRGDCWLGAAMSSIAHADRRRIQSMISISPLNKTDNNVAPLDKFEITVTLVHRRHPHVIRFPQSRLEKHHDRDNDRTKGNQIEWPSVIEEAFVELQKINLDVHNETNNKLNGGWSKHAFKAIYGIDSSVIEMPTSTMKDDHSWSILSNAASMPVASTKFKEGFFHIPAGHEYSVLSGDRSKGTVTLRNP